MQTLTRQLTVTFALGAMLFCAPFGAIADEPHQKPDSTAARQISDAFDWVAKQVSPAIVTVWHPRNATSISAGVILNSNGLLITNADVVKGTQTVKVRMMLKQTTTLEGKVVRTDTQSGLALIQLVGKDFPHARLGDSDKAKVGDWVLAFGAPSDGPEKLVTLGVISALNRKRGKIPVRMLQTDAAFFPLRNSGVLVNLDGEVVGFNNVYSSARGYAGLCFAIPSSHIKTLVPDVKSAPPVAAPAGLAVAKQFSEALQWAAEQVKPAMVQIWHPNSMGSGVIISPDGYIVTNNHVAGWDGRDVDVTLASDRSKSFKGKMIANAPRDIALVKIEGENLPYARLGDSETLRVGDWVFALGAPYFLTQTVTLGNINAVGRGGARRTLQTDAAENPGNSGGALVNLAGEVVAVNGSIQGPFFCFGTPISYLKLIMDDLKKGMKVGRGDIAAKFAPVTETAARDLGLPDAHGVLVTMVVDGRWAAKSGLQAGDVIIQFDGQEPSSVNDLRYIISFSKPGSMVECEIFRDGKPQTLHVEIGERIGWIGIWAGPLNPEQSAKLGLPNKPSVVLTRLVPKGPADAAGLRARDVFLQIAGQPVESIEDISLLVSPHKPGSTVSIQVLRGGKPLTFDVKIGDKPME